MHSNQDINSLQNGASRKEPEILTTKVRNKEDTKENYDWIYRIKIFH